MFAKIVSLVILYTCLVQGREITDHLDAQLKLINKPALKSFKTEYGDIIDCIDIHKQLAFDHPLLKNHQIQMKRELDIQETPLNSLSNFLAENVKCPSGSVPIKRATREDLIISELMSKSKGLNISAANAISPLDQVNPGRGYAYVVSDQISFGLKGIMNVWTPAIGDKQLSIGTMGLKNDPQGVISSIQGGWKVSSKNPKNTRLSTYWSGPGNTGCYNILCPGFVQVSSEITLGMFIRPSTVDGPQVEFSMSIHQDHATWDWLLVVNDKYVGYWPNAVVPGMREGANQMWWGGEVYSPPGVAGPQMGSGHYPDEGPGKVAYIRDILFHREFYVFEDPRSLSYQLNLPECYNAIRYQTRSNPIYIYFGGPGGSCAL